MEIYDTFILLWVSDHFFWQNFWESLTYLCYVEILTSNQKQYFYISKRFSPKSKQCYLFEGIFKFQSECSIYSSNTVHLLIPYTLN